MARQGNSLNRLDTLRKQVDFFPYTPVPDVPCWLDDLASIAFKNLGMLALIGPAGINVSTEQGGRVRALPDPTGVFLASLAGHMCGTKGRMAIGTPPAGRHLPLLLAGSVVLANTLDRSIDIGKAADSNVLVISPDLDVRSRYCDLYVRDIPLDQVYVGSRMRPTGERVALRHDGILRKNQGVCFFLPGLALPEKIGFSPALIVLDLRYARWTKRASALAKWVIKIGGSAGIVALYSLGDSDTLSALAKQGFANFPLDHAAIATCSERVKKRSIQLKGLTIDWWMANIPAYLIREHEVKEVENAEAIEDTLTTIGGLMDEQKQQDNADLHRTRWLLAMLTQLPVPLIWYEEAARSLGRSTLHRLITHLGVRSQQESGLGAVIQTLRMQFDELYHQMEGFNPRAMALQTWLPNVAQATPQDQILLLVRDRVVAKALQAWLELEAFPNADWLGRVDVQACSDYYKVATRRYTTVIVNGALPRRYKWIIGASLGDRVRFLAYPHEVDIIEHQLRGIYGDGTLAEHARSRLRAMNQIVSHSSDSSGGAESPIAPLHLEKVRQSPAKLAKQKTTIKDITKLAEAFEAANKATTQASETKYPITFAAWKEDLGEEEPPDDDLVDVGAASRYDSVPCIRANVNSRMYGSSLLWLAVDGIVECVRPTNPNDILRLTPDSLRPGDVLLLLDDGGRRTNLFDRIVELAEGQPRMQYLAAYRRAWQDAIQRLVAHHRVGNRINYGTILRSLQAAGATIQSELAVRFWVQDQVIGPENVSSIVAVGLVSGSDVLVREAKKFDSAFRYIRSIRQGIGHRLNSAIRRSFKHAADGISDQTGDQLDDRLGFPLDELLETIDLAEVVSVGKLTEMVAPHRVGRIRRAE